MKVLFVVLPYVVANIDTSRPKIRSFLAFPYGLLSVATYCKDQAEIKIIDMNLETMQPVLEDFNPNIVGFTMMFDNSYRYLSDLCKTVKEYNPDILTVLGGAAASYSYEEIMNEQPDLDAICFGEGELPFHKMLNGLNSNSFVTRATLESGLAPLFTPIKDLDAVIGLDYSFIDASKYDMQEAFSPFVDYSEPHKQFFVITSRGCPFKCRFCSNSKIHGKTVRFASVRRIIEHVEDLVENYGMDVLTIYDDQLLIDMDRAKDLFAQLSQFNLRVEMPNGLSVRYIDDEMASLMRNAGVDTVYLAIESGSEYVLKNLIRKPLELSQVKPVVETLRNYDFFIHGFFVLGMPGETDKHREETRKFIEYIDLDWCGLNCATPVRGSALYDECLKNGWIKKQRIGETEDKKYIINAGVPPGEIERQIYQMNLDVNFHNNRRMRIGDYKVAASCFREVIRRYEGHEIAKKYLEICNGMKT